MKLELRPDFSLTSTAEPPSDENLEGIVECKSMASITGGEIREVWAKKELLELDYAVLAVDMKVPEKFRASCEAGKIRLTDNMFNDERLRGMDTSGRASVCEEIRYAVKEGRERRDSVEALRERLRRLEDKGRRRAPS